MLADKCITKIFFLFCITPWILSAEVVIRKATLNDVPSIHQMIAHAYENHFRNIYITGYSDIDYGKNPDSFIHKKVEQNCKIAQEYVQKQLNHEDFCILVAQEKTLDPDTLLGMCMFYKKDVTTTHVRFLFVYESARKKGLGKKLLQSAQDMFVGVTACTLYTFAYANDEIHRFYEYLGFEKTGYVTLDPQYPDTHLSYRRTIK